MDPTDLPGESDLASILRLVDWITHTSNARAKVVGINAIEAILERNPYLRQVRGFMDLIPDLHKAREVVQAQVLADVVRQQRTMAVPEQPHQLHPLEIFLPGPSEPFMGRKRRSRRWRITPQPDFGTLKQPAVVSKTDNFSTISDFGTVFFGGCVFWDRGE